MCITLLFNNIGYLLNTDSELVWPALITGHVHIYYLDKLQAQVI